MHNDIQQVSLYNQMYARAWPDTLQNATWPLRMHEGPIHNGTEGLDTVAILNRAN